MTNQPLVIDVHNITKIYDGKKVVNDISFQVEKGSICGFLGPNGSGKTTLMRMLCGVVNPDAGSGYCCGHNIITESGEIKGKIGYVPQIFSLYRQLTVLENLQLMAKIYDIPDQENVINQLMERFKLNNYANIIAGNLSGGWKQKLAITSAFIHSPELIILDEPGTGIDPQTRHSIWEHLESLADQGVTILLSTHYFDEAERCDLLIYLAYGNLLATGSKLDIIEKSGLSTISIDKKLLDKEQYHKFEREMDGLGIILERGHEIFISGEDMNEVLKIVQKYLGNNFKYNNEIVQLEECFIHMLQKSGKML